jgi:hypothetical protein
MRKRQAVGVLIVCAALAGLIASASAAAGSVRHIETVSASNVRATLAYEKSVQVTGHYTLNGKSLPSLETTYSDVRASVFLGGRLLVSQLMGKNMRPANWRGKSIRIKQLDGVGRPEVLVDLYSGGAHCCYTTIIYTLGARGLSGRIRHPWGDPGYRLADIDGDGTLELVTADDAFAYAFTDYADSVDPTQIWNLQGGKLVNTTTNYPGAIKADAARLRQGYFRERSKRDVRGLLGAYVADEALLGTPDEGWTLTDTALSRGDLDQGYGTPHGSQFVASLRKFLTANGYL